MKHWCLRALVLGIVAFAAAAPASAQSVLRIARGLASSDIIVTTNRAIVVESAQPFVEVSVAQPGVADVSPLSDRSLYIFGRTRGSTTLTLLGENGKLITNVVIRVQPDLTELKQRLRTLMPRERVEARIAGTGIVLSGTVSGKDKVEMAMRLAGIYVGGNVANMMTVGGTQQVNLKVRVIEISRNAAKELGISLAAAATDGNFSGGGATNGGTATIGSPGGSATADPLNLVGINGAFGLLYQVGSLALSIRLDALESKGFSRTLAEPNLVALSGTSANFLAGGEVPIPVRDDDGAISVTFKETGVALNFQPVILDGELIRITFGASVTLPSATLPGSTSDGISIPAFDTNSAETTVELKDGQSFMVAGLIQETFSDTVGQVPWVGDIPVLGTLFRSTDFNNQQSELMIIVTVHLVTPVDDISQLATPLDRITIPNEDQLFLFGNVEGTPNPTGLATQGFDGAFGYSVE